MEKKNRQLCICNGVTEKEILKILKKGAKSLDDVKNFTLAATGCGRCKGEVEALLNQYLKNKKPDLQRDLNF
jgi:NAD(P)H-nitrite reductase large subunit